MMKRKKVLIITYYWPPAGGPGVQRWLKFVKYLPDFDWEPIVYTPLNPDFQVQDNTLLDDIPDGTLILKRPIWEPYTFFRKLTGKKNDSKVNDGLLFSNKKKSLLTRIALWIRGNILIPDPRVFWVRPSVKYLNKEIAALSPDIIVTTGPPHSIHLIGQKLHKKTNIPWVADFRDPWSNLDVLDIFSLSKYAIKKQQNLEEKVLQEASISIAVSKNWEKELGAKNTATITNGFDNTDFKDYNPIPPKKFIITYGGIITSFRSPSSLWESLNELCKENHKFKDDLHLNLIGTIDPHVVNQIKSLDLLANCTNFTPYLPHPELIKQYSRSACLLLLLNNTPNSKGHIPGKFFEYLACQKHIIAIGNTSGDVASILEESKTGLIANFNDKASIKENILNLYHQYKANNFLSTHNIEQYSRKELTKKLNSNLQKILT